MLAWMLVEVSGVGWTDIPWVGEDGELSELLFKHVFDGLWHGGFVRLVKDIGCDLVDASTGDLTTEDPEQIQLHDILEDQYDDVGIWVYQSSLL